MNFEVVTIANVECLANFEGNADYVNIKLVLATNIGLHETSAVIPHSLANLDWGGTVPQDHKQAAIATLEQWIKDGKLTPDDDNPSKLEYHIPFRGYANFWQIALTRPISSINIVSEYCKSCGITSILKARGEDYMTEQEGKDFQKRCVRWKQENRAYLEQKAQDFALFWVKCLGTLGASGDKMIDVMHALAKSDRIYPNNTDTDKLYEVIYIWAMSEFDRACIPFFRTDYGIYGQLKELLEKNFLGHLKNTFPIKTWIHIDFGDIDRSALYD